MHAIQFRTAFLKARIVADWRSGAKVGRDSDGLRGGEMNNCAEGLRDRKPESVVAVRIELVGNVAGYDLERLFDGHAGPVGTIFG